MDKRIHKIYSENILHEAASRYEIDLGSIKELGGFESYIYEYGPRSNKRILRITHSYHRSMDDLHAEMEWVKYLTDNGANVAGAVLSSGNLLAERIDAGETYFIASSIEKAPGKGPGRSVWGAPLFKEWGRAVGKLHSLTKDFKPDGVPRFQWHEEYLIRDFECYIPSDQKLIIEKTKGIIDRIKSFDTDIDSYGLIHTDIHHGNFFYDGQNITIFDFDDCAYKHFISDIAIAVFYSMMSHYGFKTKEDFAEFFLGSFLEGYALENTLDDKWLKTLPDFLKLREVILYTAICRSIDPDNPDEWCMNYMKNHRATIENDIPILKREII